MKNFSSFLILSGLVCFLLPLIEALTREPGDNEAMLGLVPFAIILLIAGLIMNSEAEGKECPREKD